MKIEIINRKVWITKIQEKRAARIKYYQEYLELTFKKNSNWFTKNEYGIAFAESYLEDAKNYYVILEAALKSDHTETIYLSVKEFNDLN